ncbi:MAG: hypothetical protein IOC63_18125 [Methylobacterium sp.]|jgi:hypothetical protein|nr:hypothetical protein [Methylobacterium sp.]MCA3643729.1 hypothetical protein [Methylobacterium sp.]
MIILSVSCRSLERAEPHLRTTGILPRLVLIQGFRSVCDVLKAVAIAFTMTGLSNLPLAAEGLRVQEKLVTDPWSGAAIGGFDPVAYFVEQRPIPGSPQHLAIHAGIAWHFNSESNRVAFLESPEAYLPALGGHDPVMVASGVPVPGHPHLFAIVEGRLFLFRRSENRERFLANASFRREAERLWPEIQRLLSP